MVSLGLTVLLAFLVVAVVSAQNDCASRAQDACTVNVGCIWRGLPFGCVQSPGTLSKQCHARNLDNCADDGNCAPGFIVGQSSEVCLPTERSLLPLCRLLNEQQCDDTMNFGVCYWKEGLCRFSVQSSGGICADQPSQSACTTSPKVCQWLGSKCAPGQQGGQAECCTAGTKFCAGKRNMKRFAKAWKQCKNVPGLQKRPASLCQFVADPVNCS